MVGICSSMLYSTLATLSEESGLSVNDLNAGTGYMVRMNCFQATPAETDSTSSSLPMAGVAYSSKPWHYSLGKDPYI